MYKSNTEAPQLVIRLNPAHLFTNDPEEEEKKQKRVKRRDTKRNLHDYHAGMLRAVTKYPETPDHVRKNQIKS